MNAQYGSTKRNKRIAAAIAGVLATMPVAFAQADVTIYGIADIAVSSLDYGQAGSKLFLTEGSGSGHSRLGANASQDLGNGLTAKANVEFGTDLTKAYSSIYLRQGWVGLSGGFGSINAGTDYNLTDFVIYGGEYCGWCGVASPSSLTSDDVRSSNYLKYMSPKMGGVSFGLGHVFGQDANRSGDGDQNEGAVFYSGGPLNVAGSYRTSTLSGAQSGQKVKDYYLTTNVSFGFGKVFALVGAQKGSSGNTTDLEFLAPSVSFKVGSGDLNFHYAQIKDKAVNNRDSQLSAVSYFYPMGKGTTAYAQYGTVKNDSGAARAPWVDASPLPSQAVGQDFTGAQVGVKYVF